MTKQTIDPDEVLYALENDSLVGFCTECGKMHDGCEPDACNCECDYCGKFEVFGAEELLIMGFV